MACACITPRCVPFTSLPLRLQFCVQSGHQLQRQYLQVEHGEREEYWVCILSPDTQREREGRAPPHGADALPLCTQHDGCCRVWGRGGAAACGVRASRPGCAGKEC